MLLATKFTLIPLNLFLLSSICRDGTFAYDMLVSDKSSPLQNVCDIFDLTNLVKSPTCYNKNSNPSLNDVILTNMPNNCMNVTNFNCGISDVHNLIAVQIKGFIIQRKNELKKL